MYNQAYESSKHFYVRRCAALPKQRDDAQCPVDCCGRAQCMTLQHGAAPRVLPRCAARNLITVPGNAAPPVLSLIGTLLN